MPSDRVQAALDEFKAALIEEGADPDTVEAQTRYILPSEVTLGGNYADLQRLGASSLAGNAEGSVPGVLMPNQPIAEPMLTKEPTDLTVEAMAPLEGMTPEEATAPSPSTGSGDREALEQMTKSELQAEADARGVEIPSSATKAEMIDALEAE
jgi:hypothetical protein